MTRFTDDLFTVAFRGTTAGFAGGAACRDVVPTGADATAYVATCTRVPVLYEYSEPPGVGPTWSKIALPGGDGDLSGQPKPGYVGAIAFMDRDHVLAVGGDASPSPGCPSCGYPRRESATPMDAAGYQDPAGHARAWVGQRDAASGLFTWHELGAGEMDPRMGGLTSADCAPTGSENPRCVAGGLRQLWTFNKNGNGRFTDRITPAEVDPGPSTLEPLGDWRFRVRQLKFYPSAVRPTLPVTPGAATEQAPEVFAVTSGCCASDPTQDTPRLLIFQPETG
ncbi:MAG TPA: hypothetical protein VGN69_09300, partial [Solirubrobacteraceae bacterium]|nr:hypothetical protein [Solirubrobacteraceae bacterium]